MARAGDKRGGEDRSNLIIAEAETDLVDLDLDAEIDKAIAKVKDGSHSELLLRVQGLEVEKEKQIAAADRHRKLQIKNINQLYDYEVEDAQALYNKAYAELQEHLVQELVQERARLKALQKNNSSGNGKAPSGEGKDSLQAGSSSRALRSQNGPVDSAESNGREKRRKVSAASKPVTGLDQVLPETSMRSDFLEIVRDLQSQAESFNRTRPTSAHMSVSASIDRSQLNVDEEVYTLGESVTVFSVLSQESFQGNLCAISESDVVIRTLAGPRLAFTLAQLQSGRVRISREQEPLSSNALTTVVSAVEKT
eukprot:gene907-990_t